MASRDYKDIIEIYSKKVYSKEDKQELGAKAKRMARHCFDTEVNNEKFISELSEEDKKELEWQIEMYKDCRRFCADYL